ncbi:MAG TPA: hypothetical protein VKE40_25090 [Gemmataceae bacterium]|nr:hypothetical protein [Gemmataceae bacterium]
MYRVLTDLRESAVFLADLLKTAVTETVRKARTGPANGWAGPRHLIAPRNRPPVEVVDEVRTPRGACWFR